MARYQTAVELIRLPANREEMARLNDYLNVTYGAQGWSMVNASLGVSANTMLVAYQRPVADDGGAGAVASSAGAPGFFVENRAGPA